MMTVGLVYGGQSEERKVSILSAKAVEKHIDKKKYKLIRIEVSSNPESIVNLVKVSQKIDVALLVLHGPGGEDGKIQAVLELMQVPYTSSGILASAISMNKHLTKRVVESLGVSLAKSHLLRRNDKPPQIKGKYVVKPNSIGSSLGTSIVDAQGLIAAIDKAFKHDSEVLVESMSQGWNLQFQ